MLLLRKKIIITIVLLLTVGCGFTPIHKSGLDNDKMSEGLAAIQIITSHDLMGQAFKTNLEDLLNPLAKNVDKKYTMEVSIGKSQIALAIQEDRTVTRYKIILSATYKLFDISSGKIIDSGVIKREGGYDKVNSDYATYVSEEDTTKRILRELAEDTKIRVLSAILSM